MIHSFFVPRGTPFRGLDFDDTTNNGFFDSVTNNDNLFTTDQGGLVTEINTAGDREEYFQFNVDRWVLRIDPKYVNFVDKSSELDYRTV